MTATRFKNPSMTRTTPSDPPRPDITMAEVAERRSAKSKREEMPLIDSYGQWAKTLKPMKGNSRLGIVHTSGGNTGHPKPRDKRDIVKFVVALGCEHMTNDAYTCRFNCDVWKAGA